MKVFISFAQADHRLMHSLSGALVEAGISPLVAIQRLAPGSRLDDKVEAMIQESDCVVVLNTPKTLLSRWVQQEIGCAKGRSKYIVPLKTRGTRLGAMLEGLEHYQFKMSDPREDFVRVASFLRTFAEERGLPVAKVNEGLSRDSPLVHLPRALLCPKCGLAENHVFVCLLCGEWICTDCGATIPPTSRAADAVRPKRES